MRPPENRQFFGRDPLLEKSVMIIKGPYKGYMGICKEVNGPTARIELHTNAKIISIPRDQIDEPSNARGSRGEDRPKFDGGKTPMYGSGAKTPMHSGNDQGGKTPHW